MRPLEVSDRESTSLDIVGENIARLRELFPEVWTEGGIDFDALKQLLGGAPPDHEEKFGLNWHGKRQARQLALTPSTGTLRPRPEESVNWDTTQNLMIEGDNLEVLKLLQKSYAGRVKMIYIDPPYNTGNDFIYPDDYRDGVRNYLSVTGQLDDGGAASSRPETGGRFHTRWLNMMYPRVKLARTLLQDDGIIFISIDDAEAANLRLLCNDVFGEENFVATFVRRRRMATGMRGNPVSPDHEYIVAYAKKLVEVDLHGVKRREEDYPHEDAQGRYSSTDLTVGKTRLQRPNQFYRITHPGTGSEYWPPDSRVWRFEPGTMEKQLQDDNIIWPDDNPSGRMERPRFKTRFDDGKKAKPVSTWIDYGKSSSTPEDDAVLELRSGLNEEATKEVRSLFGEQLLEYPKPVSLLHALCALGSREDDIVLDFFAGSGSTAHAVWSANQEDGGRRRFILVQLPELTGRDDYPTIAAITRERLRRAGTAIASESPLLETDLGFKAFRLDSSNIRAWNPSADSFERSLLDAVSRVEPDRTTQDVLYELLLKRGLDLIETIEERTIVGKTVHCVAGGTLLVCLADSIATPEVEAVAQGIATLSTRAAPPSDKTCVVLDRAFTSDAARTNFAAILQQQGITQLRSI